MSKLLPPLTGWTVHHRAKLGRLQLSVVELALPFSLLELRRRRPKADQEDVRISTEANARTTMCCKAY
jgi:hypothetical protein